MACPLCTKRPAKRFCPAKGESICAVCCGTEREVTIDCPGDCNYLVAARRYEAEHPRPITRDDVPYPDVEFSPGLIHERRAVVSGFAYHILMHHAEHRETVDADALAALATLAETFRTLAGGILYEKPPEGGPARALYTALAHFVEEYRKNEAQHGALAPLKDVEVFYVLVFLLRVGKRQTNGRPRSRAYLDFLRAQFPRSGELRPEAPRIILPD